MRHHHTLTYTDQDGSGKIDVPELRATLQALGQHPTDEELFLMISSGMCRDIPRNLTPPPSPRKFVCTYESLATEDDGGSACCIMCIGIHD